MKTTKRVDGMIYLAHVNNEIVCYESNHRREALRGVEDVAPILVDFLWNATDEMLKDEFRRLNKAVSVPDLYVSEESTVNIAEIRDAVDGFCKNYAKLKVATGRPHRPSFNRDMVTDEFYRVMRENKISVTTLVGRLKRLNDAMALRDKSKLPPKVVAKCEEAGMWLFAWSSKFDAKELA
jgi:hypothetical protein